MEAALIVCGAAIPRCHIQSVFVVREEEDTAN